MTYDFTQNRDFSEELCSTIAAGIINTQDETFYTIAKEIFVEREARFKAPLKGGRTEFNVKLCNALRDRTIAIGGERYRPIISGDFDIFLNRRAESLKLVHYLVEPSDELPLRRNKVESIIKHPDDVAYECLSSLSKFGVELTDLEMNGLCLALYKHDCKEDAREGFDKAEEHLRSTIQEGHSLSEISNFVWNSEQEMNLALEIVDHLTVKPILDESTGMHLNEDSFRALGFSLTDSQIKELDKGIAKIISINSLCHSVLDGDRAACLAALGKPNDWMNNLSDFESSLNSALEESNGNFEHQSVQKRLAQAEIYKVGSSILLRAVDSLNHRRLHVLDEDKRSYIKDRIELLNDKFLSKYESVRHLSLIKLTQFFQ